MRRTFLECKTEIPHVVYHSIHNMAVPKWFTADLLHNITCNSGDPLVVESIQNALNGMCKRTVSWELTDRTVAELKANGFEVNGKEIKWTTQKWMSTPQKKIDEEIPGTMRAIKDALEDISGVQRMMLMYLEKKLDAKE